MAIPKIKEQDIIDALKYIDENGVPSHNLSTKYEMVTAEGMKYPPKYVIAVASHIASGADISTDGFNGHSVKRCVSENRQSQGWRWGNRADSGLEPLVTARPGGQGGMRALA